MNPINHKIKEQGEAFEEEFSSLDVGLNNIPFSKQTGYWDIKSFLTQSQHELLDTVVEVLDEIRPCQHCNTKQEALRLLKDSKDLS